MKAGDQGGRVETAILGQIGCRLKHRAISSVPINQTGNRLQLDRVHDGADIDAFVQRIADAQLLHPGAQLGIESLGNWLMHQQAGACTTDLPLIEPDRVHQTFDRAVLIGIVKDDVGRLATQLER